MRVVGVTGNKRSGKDTIGKILQEKGYQPLSFAKKLKDAVHKHSYVHIHTVSGGDESRREEVGSVMILLRDIIRMAKFLEFDRKLYYPFQCRFLEVFQPYVSMETDLGVSYKMSERTYLQLLGTEVCRYFKDSIWVDFIRDEIENNPKNKYVITDVRFDNEAEMITANGGKVVCVVREGMDGDGHVSEKGVSSHLIDFIIENNGTFEDLRAEINKNCSLNM
jgi:hypothetical protein